MRLQSLSVAAALASRALAGVKFTSPAAGASVAAGTIAVEWEDDNTSPSLDDLSGYTLQLMVGGNEESNSLPLTALSTRGTFATGTTAQGTVQANLAGSTKNGFYLKMVATATEGGTVTYYSDRFTLTGMTGTTPAQYVTAAKAVDGTDGPDTVDAVANAAPAAGAAAGGEFTVPYGLQTGLTKYAPMQAVPPTKISVKDYTPLYPTSAFTIATTRMARPSVVTTMTATQTFKVSQRENTVAAQAQPSDDMAKFLARWKD